MNIQLKKFIPAVVGTLLIGFLSSFFSQNASEIYQNLNLPTFAPPAGVFGIVWTILYILMGIAFYLILIAPNSVQKRDAIFIYVAQLVVNFFWSVIFFGFQNYIGAFWWLALLIVLVSVTIYRFYRVNPYAAYLLIPYMLWILFAAVLNLSIYFLNK